MVNSLTCSAKVKPSQIKLPLISVTTISSLNNQVGLQGVVPSIAVSAEAAAEMSGLAMLTENAINGSTVSDHHPAVVSGIRNGSTAVVESAAGLLPSGVGSLQDSKINPVSSVVKMEVLDDLFGSYGWDESASAMAAAVSAAASNNPFSSLLSQMTPLTSASTSTLSTVATTKGTVKVPMASETSTTTEALPPQGVDTTFSPPPPPPSSLPTISLASSLTTESLRVIIPSPHHPGPDTTTTMGGSPVANHNNNHTPTTPAAPTTPSSVASSSSTSSKKTVFTAKGMLLLLYK